MADTLGSAPILSTPDTHILNETTPVSIIKPFEKISDEELGVKYEISRTIQEIKSHQWTRVALQFPDNMLSDSARVFQMLARGLKQRHPLKSQGSSSENESSHALADLGETLSSLEVNEADKPVKLTILADTSYGSCCVDEIAAEHVEADAVIHYGRACLSPTARLPVVYIFTKQELDAQYVVKAFRDTFPDFQEKVIVTADVTYSSKVYEICSILMQAGYKNTFASSIIHNPSSLSGTDKGRTLPDS